jgi:hypothetical protein
MIKQLFLLIIKTIFKTIKPYVLFRNKKVWYVDFNSGSDDNTGSFLNPYKTIGFALSKSDGSGFRIIIAPGVYTEDITISLANIDIVPLSGTERGNSHIEGTVTFSNSTSSSGIQGISMKNLVHAGAGSLYVTSCQIKTLFSKTSSGYLEIKNSQLQGTSISTITNGTGLLRECLIANMTISGATTGFTLKSNIIDATGSVSFLNGAFYNLQDNSGNIITTAGNSIEAGLIAQGLPSALAKQYVTDFSNKLAMLNPDTNTNPTSIVSYDPTTKRLEATPISFFRTWLDYVTGYTTIETLSNINGVQKIKYTYSFGTAYRLIDTVNDTDAIYSNEACTSLITNKKI